MKHLIIATTPLQAKIAQHIKGLYPDQEFVNLYVSPVKNARQEHYAKGFDHVYYPQTAEDLAQICQELKFLEFVGYLLQPIDQWSESVQLLEQW